MSSVGGDTPAEPRGDAGKQLKATPAMGELGQALGRDLPRSYKRTADIAARIRRVSRTPPAQKAR